MKSHAYHRWNNADKLWTDIEKETPNLESIMQKIPDEVHEQDPFTLQNQSHSNKNFKEHFQTLIKPLTQQKPLLAQRLAVELNSMKEELIMHHLATYKHFFENATYFTQLKNETNLGSQ